MKRYLAYIVTLLFTASCSNRKGEDTLFQLVVDSGIDFTNKVENSKDFNIFSYRNFYNGGGVGIGDINNDGLADVFMTANMGSNKLYLNKGNFQFDDITEKAGIGEKEKWSTGVVMVDINADGWLDVYVCNAGYQKGIGQENSLFINNRDLTFTECARKYGLADPGYTTHAAFFDYDLDGDLDCYILNNSFIPVSTLTYENKRNLRAEDWPVADFLKGGGDKLLRNESGKFVDISKEANIYGSLIGFGLGVTVGDINNDQYPDLYISNDFFERDYLYINQRNGTYKEELEQWMQHTSLASMGADIGDINNDGYPDIFTTDMLPDDDYRLKTTSQFENIDVYRIKQQQGYYHQYMQNTLQLNNKDGSFSDVAYYSGVAASDWSWGGLILDADNDSRSDIFVCNGIYHDLTDQDFMDFFANDIIRKMALTGKKEEVDNIINKMPSKPIPNKAFRNLGNVKFSDESKRWGLDAPSFSSGAAYGDLDNDGDLDLVINNVNQKSFIYKNRSQELTKANYISLSLSGKDQNTYAV
ncbi:MAG TPA: VCBS repeat-containing protein, partial [Flavisolibacter sp.]|nr:VCBS repeat-containing protein [Flavisolibacter sp.]